MLTDFTLDAGIDFNTAMDCLQRMKPMPYDVMETALRRTRSLLGLSSIVREFGLHNDERLKTLVVVFDPDSYFSTLLEVLSSLFPMETDLMEQNALAEGDLYIIPEPLGMNNFTGEEFLECIHEPESVFGVERAVEVFIRCLDYSNWMDGEDWDNCNEFFGWQVDNPPVIADNCSFSREKLTECLKCAGMEPFLDAMDVSLGGDNIFFEFNAYDEGGYEPIEFNRENIEWLIDEWAEAKVKIKKTEEAEKMAAKDPGLFQKFADLWAGSFLPNEKPRIGLTRHE